MAMNGWADAEPAWWLNLQAQPDTIVELKDGPRAVRGPCRERRRSGRACGRGGPTYDEGSRRIRRPAVWRDRGRHPVATNQLGPVHNCP